MTCCEYCRRPANQIEGIAAIVDNTPHNPNCPLVEGNSLEDWQKGKAWGFNYGSDPDANWPRGKSDTFYLGVDIGRSDIESLIQDAAEEEYYGVHEREI